MYGQVDYSDTAVITMDYVDVVCNGKQATTTKSGQTTQAGAMEQLNQKYQQPASSLNWLIYMLFARQEYACCKEIIDQQLKNSFDKEYLYHIKGQIARLEGAQQDSLYFLQQAIEMNPGNYENYKEIGITLYGMRRWKQSLEAFTKAESLLPRPDPQVYHFIGELLYRNIDRTGRPAATANITAAKEYFHRAIQNGKPIESYQRLATIYREELNYAKAIEMLDSILQIIPDHADTLTDIGILYLKISDTKNAFDKLFEVTKLTDNCGRALIALGAILQSKNDVDGALNKYKLIDATKEDTAELWNNIGLCFYKKRKFIAAISCLKKSVWISPLNFSCLYNLGLVYLTAQQYASAYYTFASAINLRPDHAECYMLLGVCLKNLADPQNAFLAFERSTMLPDAIKNPLIYLNFAIHCHELERHEQTRQYLQNFLDMTAHMKIRNEYVKLANQLMKKIPEIEQQQPVADEEVTAVATANASSPIDGGEELIAIKPDAPKQQDDDDFISNTSI